VTTVLDGLRARAVSDCIVYTEGCKARDADESGIGEAVQLAARCDVVIAVVGDTLAEAGEEGDRSELDLSCAQLPLLKALKASGKPLIVVLINSKPLCIPWVADNADAIIEAFNPGMLGGQAIAELIYGDFNPSGKLTVSFPRSVGQQPIFYQQTPGWHGNKHGTYDATPVFSFGFGLSFTTYSYSTLTLDATKLTRDSNVSGSFEVTNTGDRAGVEVAQVYFNDLFTSLSTPSKQLCRFFRLALKPGETRRVSFVIPVSEFAFVGRDGKRILEAGDFELMVGPSSRAGFTI
jgi:beta-glucosidase